MLDYGIKASRGSKIKHTLLNTTCLVAGLTLGMSMPVAAQDLLVDNGDSQTADVWPVRSTTYDNLHVGMDGEGTYNLIDHSTVYATFGVLGGNASGFGLLNVDAAEANGDFVQNAYIFFSDSLDIGLSGHGQANFVNGATGRTPTLTLGVNAGSTGGMLLSGVDDGGDNSHMNVTGTMTVGERGIGTVIVEGGAGLETETTVIGALRDNGERSLGTVTVTGDGSYFGATDGLYVGRDGDGMLVIADGAEVNVGDMDGILEIAENAGSIGTVIIGAAPGSEPGRAGNILADEIHFGAGEGSLIFNHDDMVYFYTTITGDGTIASKAGYTVLDNDLSGFTGTTAVSGGMLVVHETLGGTVELTGGTLQNKSDLTGTINISGTGSLYADHDISGVINATGGTIHGPGTFNGAISVTDGAFSVNGNTTGTINVTGGRLKGVGTAGIVNILSGGTVAPGNSIGTLTVATANFDPGSVYEVEVDDTGASDLLDVTGTATLNGGTVHVIPAAGTYNPATAYTILTAGTLSGQFDGATSTMAFLVPTLQYDYVAGEVILRLVYRAFSDSSQTANENAIGGVLDSMGVGTPYATELQALDAAAGKAALNQMTGEGYAAVNGIMVEDSRYLRDAVLGRLDAPTEDSNRFWAEFYGGLTTLAGDSNAGEANASAGGLVLGADAALGDAGRFGFVLGAGTTSTDNRSTGLDSADLSLGAYGITELGPLTIKLGAAYTHHLIDGTRTLDFLATPDVYTSSYAAGTTQGFVEVSHDFDLGGFTLTPYGGLAAISQSSDAFTETGGIAALGVSPETINALISTLGLGFTHSQNLENGSTLVFSGSAGWRHAFADQPTTQNSLSGNVFDISGPSISADSLSLDAAVNLTLVEGVTLGAAYGGQLSGNGTAHAFKASVSGNF